MSTLDEYKRLVEKEIDSEELKELILTLCNIKSPYLFEKEAGDFVYDWMKKEGFDPRRVGMKDRFNVVGTLKGDGTGKSVLFSSHLDTGGPRDRADDLWMCAKDNIDNPYWHEASFKDGKFFGQGVDNDKGPMACFLIAAKAIQKMGVPLKGDIYLTACPGEMGQEPVSEYQGAEYISKDIGAEYMMIHGGIMADFGVSAEGTDFGVSWVEAGKAFFKITVHGKSMYTPVMQTNEDLLAHNNPIMKCGPLLDELNRYALEYEKKYTIDTKGGKVIPKIQVGAIRGGLPYFIIGGTEVCELYLDCRITPGMEPKVIYKDLKKIIDRMGVKADIELFLFRQGREADEEKIAPYIKLLNNAHKEVFHKDVEISTPGFSSMWRDHNVFNEYLIPSVTYGPSRYCPSLEDMVNCAKAYAMIALEVAMTDDKEI
ncbi:MAG: M20/M25/M40 family metallo-hydrolase [Lachnospiraceae bacterium]|nr:M20/M25/M40 family metallo-hydrolase [Lachnospiraceae bacterium]